MKVNVLSVKAINAIKVTDIDQTFSDGNGLSLLVKADDKGKVKKWWRMRYTVDGKRKLKSFGTYPEISLADARKERDRLRGDIANGKKEEIEIVTPITTLTFKECAEQRFELSKAQLSETHIERTKKGFKKDVYPLIGDTDIKAVTVQDIKHIMRQMKKREVVASAYKMFSAISKVFKYAIANDYTDRNFCLDIDLQELIGKKKTTSYPIITDDKELFVFLITIDDYKGHYTTRMALKVLSHIFLRPYNIRHLEWSEVNFKSKQIIIPANKMKTKNELIVPLSKQVIAMLKEVQEFTAESRYVFPSFRGINTAMSDMTLVGALRRMGYSRDEVVAHSFRGIFSTIAHEKSDFEHAVIEKQLAHSVGNSVSQAYNRAEHLEKRVQLMQWWSDYLDRVVCDA